MLKQWLIALSLSLAILGASVSVAHELTTEQAGQLIACNPASSSGGGC